ncbi:MAG: TolC family protein [Planctomycetota bacterium]|nr:MAG: TolC family protein [Planctomycetota bacterium]
MLLVLGFLSPAAGCIRVDARPDMRRARRLIAGRTGVEQSYDPETEASIEAMIRTRLEDGLTVEEAVQIAMLNNKRFQARVQEIGVARADLVQAGLLSNPSFGISPRFPEGGGRANLTLTMGQELADLWQIPLRRRLAEGALEEAVLRVARAANDLVFDVRRTCYEWLAFQRLEQAAQETLRLAETSLSVATHRFEAGDANQVDVNLARANVLEARARLIELRGMRRAARHEVGHLLGLARWEPRWTLQDAIPAEPLPPQDETDLIVFAMRERLDAQAAEREVHAAEDRVRREYRRVIPHFAVGWEWERVERRALPGRKLLADTARASVANGRLTAPSIQSRAERRRERSQIIDSLLGPTFDLTLPLWDQNQAQIAKARFQAVEARKRYEAILDDVARDVREALAAARSTEELVSFLREKGLPLAQAHVESAKRAYEAGQIDILNVVDAERRLIAQREAYIQAQRDHAVAMAQLRRALGGRLPPETEQTEPARSSPTEETTRP